ncbi:hypothetical protein [Pseudomonas sp. JL3]|uniref:hypothetical protein n=1 Tax=Pseudomonas sp. JL3 TaxID=2919943 RepID=UPI00285CFB5E|nr:hypothetical protein [Pseudomonas sp. JL3]MDR8364053.1 hypothetical protein [Pseudomonas sp. JL3]
MSLKKALNGMSIALIAFTHVMTAQAASDHEIAVAAVALHQECGKKHPDMVLSLEQFISLHTHMSDQLADDVREIATQSKYKIEVEQAVIKINSQADQDLVEAVCNSYYREVNKR